MLTITASHFSYLTMRSTPSAAVRTHDTRPAAAMFFFASAAFFAASAMSIASKSAHAESATTMVIPASEVVLSGSRPELSIKFWGPDTTTVRSVFGRELESVPHPGEFTFDPRTPPTASYHLDERNQKVVDSVVIPLLDGDSAEKLSEDADADASASTVATQGLQVCVAFTRKGYESCLEGISQSYPVEFAACTSANRHRVAGWSETGELDISTMEDECRIGLNINHPGAIIQSVRFPENIILRQK